MQPVFLCIKGVIISKPEEERLKKENEELRKKIEAMKVQLVMTEIRNGGKCSFLLYT